MVDTGAGRTTNFQRATRDLAARCRSEALRMLPGLQELIIGMLGAIARYVHELCRDVGRRGRKRSPVLILGVGLGKAFVGGFCGYSAFLLAPAAGIDPKWTAFAAGAMGILGGDFLIELADRLMHRFLPPMKPTEDDV